MNILQECRDALDVRNVQAFLRVIREGETNQESWAYRMIVGGGLFTDFSDHPRQRVWIENLKVWSTAAGCYQFLSRTWDGCAKALSLPDFSPAMQDIAAVYLIRGRGALRDVIEGRFEAAIAKCAPEWASLPGSQYGQPTKTMHQARLVYQTYGGTYAPAGAPIAPALVPAQPPAPAAPPGASIPTVKDSLSVQPEKPMLPALLVGLATSLIDAFSPLARDKVRKELARHGASPEVADQVYTAVIETAKTATGTTDPIAATAQATAAPEVLVQVQDSAIATLDQMAPLLDKLAQWDQVTWAAEEASRDAAAARAKSEDYDMTPLLLRGAFVVLGLLILLVGVIVGVQVYKTDSPDTATWSALTGLIGWATGTVTVIYAYRFGTTRSSAAKDVVIGELSKRKA